MQQISSESKQTWFFKKLFYILCGVMFLGSLLTIQPAQAAISETDILFSGNQAQIALFIQANEKELKSLDPEELIELIFGSLTKKQLLAALFEKGHTFTRNIQLVFETIYPNEPASSWMGVFITYLLENQNVLKIIEKAQKDGKVLLAEWKPLLALLGNVDDDTTFVRDKKGRVLHIVFKNKTTQFIYSANKMRAIERYNDGKVVISDFDNRGLLRYREKWDPKTGIRTKSTFEYEFDGSGRVQKIIENEQSKNKTRRIVKDRFDVVQSIVENGKLAYQLTSLRNGQLYEVKASSQTKGRGSRTENLWKSYCSRETFAKSLGKTADGLTEKEQAAYEAGIDKQLVQTQTFSEDGKSSILKKFENGFLKEILNLNAAGKITRKEFCEPYYSTANDYSKFVGSKKYKSQKTKSYSYDKNQKLIGKQFYKDNQLRKSESYSPGGGQLVSRTNYNASGDRLSQESYRNGQLTSKSYFNSNGSSKRVMYDESGKRTGSLYSDKKGNRVRYESSDGSITLYDNKKNLVTCYTKTVKGMEKTIYTALYGKLISREIVSENIVSTFGTGPKQHTGTGQGISLFAPVLNNQITDDRITDQRQSISVPNRTGQ